MRRTGRPVGRPRGHKPTVYGKRGLGNGSKRCIKVHRLRAEQALGKPLPLGAVVHHADGTLDDDAPLVICQDIAYHELLHFRMGVVTAGGNPNTDKVCRVCRTPKHHEQFHRNARGAFGRGTICKPCDRVRDRGRR